jgi:N4-(beta-N-acetylglucosaminyl)-L-asparaginase
VTDAITRRDFLGTAGSLAGATFAIPHPITQPRPLPPASRWAAAPVVVASANGLRGVAKAYELLLAGADTLDAGVEGVKIQELDPQDTSVGYGGLPNEEGVVQLDASCMHGPSKRAGAVAALEGIKTPSEVAKLVLKYTDHILLVGKGAKRFALSFGLEEADLMTPRSREAWLRWRQNRGASDDWLNVTDDDQLLPRPTGTINCNVVGATGEISSITTTSGLAWKIPGRAGDSPIIGAGQYTDPEVGAAGSTGRGESNIMVCGAFLCVEMMRRGMSPTDAGLETLRRVLAMSEPRLLGDGGRPRFGLSFYLVNKRGEFGGVSLTPSRYAVCDADGARHLDTAFLFERR